MPIWQVARLIRSVWEDKDRDYMDAITPGYWERVDARGTELFVKSNAIPPITPLTKD
jgi:hypothetical protein